MSIKKLLTIVIACVLVCGGSYYSLLWLNRPLFYDNFDWYKESLSPSWYPNPSLLDQHGNFAYIDFRDDLVVLIATDGTVTRNTIPRATINYSRLLHDTPFEAVIEKQQNKFLIIDRNGERTHHNLEGGFARELFGKSKHVYPSGENLRDVILREIGETPDK